jgi:ATP-dependent Clp protease ATP-binding subunit ClpC
VLAGLDLTVDGVRERLKALVPAGEDPSPAQMPFTPHAKRVLEVALREAPSESATG